MNPPPTTTARFGFVTTWKPVYESIPVLLSVPRSSHSRMVRASGHGPHREDPREVDAGQRRPDRGRAGRQHQLVVGLGRDLAGRVVAQVDGLRPSARWRSPRSRVRTSTSKTARNICSVATRRLDSSGITPADVVGQPAVRVRDVRAALHHEDLGLLVQPAQARRTGRPARHSADDDDLHVRFLSRSSFPPDCATVRSGPSLPWPTRSRSRPPADRPRARWRRECGDRSPSEGAPRAPPGIPTSRRARRPAPGPAPRRCGRRRNPAGPARAPERPGRPRAPRHVGPAPAGS